MLSRCKMYPRRQGARIDGCDADIRCKQISKLLLIISTRAIYSKCLQFRNLASEILGGGQNESFTPPWSRGSSARACRSGAAHAATRWRSLLWAALRRGLFFRRKEENRVTASTREGQARTRPPRQGGRQVRESTMTWNGPNHQEGSAGRRIMWDSPARSAARLREQNLHLSATSLRRPLLPTIGAAQNVCSPRPRPPHPRLPQAPFMSRSSAPCSTTARWSPVTRSKA